MWLAAAGEEDAARGPAPAHHAAAGAQPRVDRAPRQAAPTPALPAGRAPRQGKYTIRQLADI